MMSIPVSWRRHGVVLCLAVASATACSAGDGGGTGGADTSNKLAPSNGTQNDEKIFLAAKPPMGWNTWNRFFCAIDERLVREMADAMVSSGLKDAGYEYLLIDDCWQKDRDASGAILPDPATFPSGMPTLVEYVHSKGLKFGIYTDAGTGTCQGRPGSLGHEQQDAKTYASWGVDYVKVDWCFSQGLDPREQYSIFRDAIDASGRPMVYSICNWGVDAPWEWAPQIANLWRTTDDLIAANSWDGIRQRCRDSSRHAAVAGPRRWNDPDVMVVGLDKLNAVEDRTHFSLWAISAAPLFAANDLRTMSLETKETLTNPEVIAVDQDPAGIQGVKVREEGGRIEVWAKPLQGKGERAVLVVNTGEAEEEVTVSWGEIGLAEGSAKVRDLWARADRGESTNYEARVAPHGVVMLKVSGEDAVVPKGGVWDLDKLTWTYGASGWGTPEKGRTNGGEATGDGGPIRLGGKEYAQGLGVHAESNVRFRLDGHCSSFSSDVGIDDASAGEGSVVFQIWGDGVELFESPVVHGGAGERAQVRVDLSGVQELRLVVTGAGDDVNSDHADWAGAELDCR